MGAVRSWLTPARLKPPLFLAALLPFLFYGAALWMDRLGANPIEVVTRASGDWALRFLLLTLAITPLRRLTGWPLWMRFRRMLGLFAFFYASVHVLLYLWLDQFFSWPDIWLDILDRPFITAGFVAFVILVPLAMTSTRAMMRRLKKRWAQLHKSVYIAAIAAVLHFWWMKSSKSDVSEPMLYSLILVTLLSFRLRPLLTAISRRFRLPGMLRAQDAGVWDRSR